MQSSTHSKYLALILVFTMPISGMNIDINAPSLPAMAAYFGVDKSLVQLTVTCYLIGFLITQFFIGPLIDNVGRKKPLLVANGLYIVITLLAANANNIYELLVFRSLQGMCMGCVIVVARTIMQDSYQGKALEKIVSTTGMVWSIGPIIAPAIGGHLQSYFNWHAPFYFLLFYSFILFYLNIFHLPETLRTKQIFKSSVMFQNYKTILCHKPFLFNAICLALLYSDIILFGVVAPFLIQTKLHYSAAQFGEVALLIGVALFLGNSINRAMIHIHSSTRIKIGLWVMLVDTAGMLIFSLLTPMTLYTIMIPVFIFIVSGSIVYPNYSIRMLSLFPKMAGSVNALTLAFNIISAGMMTIIAAFLKSDTQVPIAAAYMLICLTCLVLFYLDKQNRMK